MGFAINFVDIVRENMSPKHDKAVGQIIIGDFKEELIIPLDFWLKSDYIEQWKDGVNKIISTGGEVRSALITEMYNPKHPDFPAMYWALYRTDEAILIQNYYQPLNTVQNDFTYDDLYKLIADRENPITKDIAPVSEWTTTLDELKEWQEKLK
jgi:hypothetical protein